VEVTDDSSTIKSRVDNIVRVCKVNVDVFRKRSINMSIERLLIPCPFQVRMMEERLVKGEYCLSTSGVGSPPHSLPSTSGTQNDKIEEVHCACISKLETQVEEQVKLTVPENC